MHEGLVRAVSQRCGSVTSTALCVWKLFCEETVCYVCLDPSILLKT